MEQPVTQTYTPLPQNDPTFSKPYGGFITRLAAYLFDYDLFFIPFILLSLALPTGLKQYQTYLGCVFVIGYYSYLVVFLKRRGKTLGKHIFGLKVVREDYGYIGWIRSVQREVVGRIILNFFLLGYLNALINKKKQAFHDIFAKTIVIQAVPLSTFQKWLRFFIIFALPIILTILVMILSISNPAQERNKTDRIESINQKVQLIKTVSQSDVPVLRQVGQTSIASYTNEIGNLCKKQYTFKTDCKLEDLNNINLDILNASLERSINDLITAQQNYER